MSCWFMFLHMVVHDFVTCDGGSCVYMSWWFICLHVIMFLHVMVAPVFTCHGGSCFLHVMLILEFSMFWWFLFFYMSCFYMSWWFMLFYMSWWFMSSYTCHGGQGFGWVGIFCYSDFFCRDGRGIVGGKVLLQVPPRKDNSLSAVSSGINLDMSMVVRFSQHYSWAAL